LLLAKLAALIACENKFSPIRLLNFLTRLFVSLNKILAFALKNIQASLIFLAHLLRIFEINLQDTCARFEKYSSKLDISHSLIRIFIPK
jgi:hypothetical protein